MALIASAPSTVSSTVLTLTSAWLKDPANPSLNFQLALRSFDPHVSTRPQGVFYPLNSKFPVVVSGTPQSYRGAFTFLISTQTELDALNALVLTPRTLLFQKPLEGATGPATSMFIQLTGDLTFTRIAQPADRPHREVTISYVEVAAPVVVL